MGPDLRECLDDHRSGGELSQDGYMNPHGHGKEEIEGTTIAVSQGQQGQQSANSSSSSQQSSQQAPSGNVKLGDESLKIETVEIPADESLVGQQDDKKKETKDSIGKSASGQQGPRRNTGVEQGDAMPSDI